MVGKSTLSGALIFRKLYNLLLKFNSPIDCIHSTVCNSRSAFCHCWHLVSLESFILWRICTQKRLDVAFLRVIKCNGSHQRKRYRQSYGACVESDNHGQQDRCCSVIQFSFRWFFNLTRRPWSGCPWAFLAVYTVKTPFDLAQSKCNIGLAFLSWISKPPGKIRFRLKRNCLCLFLFLLFVTITRSVVFFYQINQYLQCLFL